MFLSSRALNQLMPMDAARPVSYFYKNSIIHAFKHRKCTRGQTHVLCVPGKVQSVCEVQSKQTVIEVNGCKSTQAVNITSCAGHCGSSSVYSAAANTMIHQCECCQEASTRQMQVELTCSNGSKLQHTYTQVQTCSCSKAECGAGTTSKPQHRRRR
uniref:CTCK domain-containing protein n=1 Tax=Acanthochromis polyacanthus TaxID=80966 RepID=A0A3Q1EP97_9TELE